MAKKKSISKKKRNSKEQRKRRNKRVQITERDTYIFKVLAKGVAMLSMILRLLSEVHGIETTREALKRRLWLLCCGGYIESDKYSRVLKHGHTTMYALTKKSMRILTTLGIHLEEISFGLPNDTLMLHERAVTKTLHTIIMEANRGLYDYTHWNSTALRQKREKGSREPIPDLYVSVTTTDSRIIYVRIEVDMGTRPAHLMARQLSKQVSEGELIVVLCISDGRIESLINACHGADSIYMANVLFAKLENFWDRGFQGTALLNIYGDKQFLAID